MSKQKSIYIRYNRRNTNRNKMSVAHLAELVEKNDIGNVFIGFGNPDSRILIIGKEMSFPPDLNDIEFAVNTENKKRWKEFLLGKNDDYMLQSTEWKDVPRLEVCRYFNPAKPFYGQRKTIVRKLKNGSNNGGTSCTWYWYQRMIDGVTNVRTNKADKIDFYKYCFLTELSQVTKAYSDYSDETKTSVQERLLLLKEPFFQDFKIIVAACKGYLNTYGIDLHDIFPHSTILVTRQLSMNVSIADLRIDEIKKALSENSIQLDK